MTREVLLLFTLTGCDALGFPPTQTPEPAPTRAPLVAEPVVVELVAPGPTPEAREAERERTEALGPIVDAMQRLTMLTDRWVKQLDVLSKMLCATGAGGQVAADWAKGEAGRVGELDAMTDTVAEEAPVAGPQWVDTFALQREHAVKKVAVALKRAERCE